MSESQIGVPKGGEEKCVNIEEYFGSILGVF